MHFYCQCLNVTINIIEINDNEKFLPKFLSDDIIPYLNRSEHWFECDLSSIHIAWQSLCQSLSIREININRCLVCNMYTHITTNQSNRILINKNLFNDKTVKNSYLDRNYSKITKIIMPNQQNNSAITHLQNETFQREFQLAQQLYRQSIDDADQETEEKIRMFQYEQEQILERRKQEMNQELEIFLNFMRSIPRYSSSNKTSPILQTSNSYLNENSMESGFGSEIFDFSGIDSNRQSSMFERTFSERTSNIDDDINDDPLLDNGGWFSEKDISPECSPSLPKNIAITSYYNVNNDNNDLESIGKSFRQLSQSLVCTDGTELFGDLPSPRHNNRQT